jgi:hypothetical protein
MAGWRHVRRQANTDRSPSQPPHPNKQWQVPVTGHVTTGGSNVYKIWNGDPHAHILVSATTLSGGKWA